MNRRIRTFGAAAVTAAALASAGGVSAQQALSGPVPAAPRNVLSINPLGVVFSVYSGEYERAIGGNASAGVAMTFWRHTEDYDNATGSADARVNYFSTDAKLRYYPTQALRGFSVGGLVGMSRLGGALQSCETGSGCEELDDSALALSTGVEVDYNWNLGRRENFFIGIGLGAKRLFPIDEDVDATLAYPFGRFTIGIGF